MAFPSEIKKRYQIKEELGAGGMGAVYRAYDKTIKSEVALKTILDINDVEGLRMFREECDKLARMVHPNIVEIRDVGEFDGGSGKQPYLVMPLLRGKTLDHLIKGSGKRLSVSRCVDILSQSCRGLQAAHEAGLVHRDVKPSNIFVLEDDSVKLIDFGVAHWSDHTHTVGRKGTLLFMSPEQIQMKGVSALSDIFSLGVVAYQTLTGRSPFERPTEEGVVDAILNYVPPPASEYNAEVSLALSQAVHKAMAKKPSNRYRSAKEFGEILQKALHEQPIEIFNPARIQPRIEQATQVLDKGDLDLASEIIGELEAEGHLDPQVIALQRRIDQCKRTKKVQNLLEGARTRMKEQEYPLALQKIQEALEIDKGNSDALALKESVESRRADQSVNDWLQLARQHTDNFAHERAREALRNVLQLKPNDSRAVAMLAEVDRRKSDYEKVLGEKHKLYEAAEAAFGRGDISSALSKMDRVLQLDKRAPDRTHADRGTSYQSLYNQIRSEHDSMQSAYSEARALQSAGDYLKALALCNENLAKQPGHALLQALKLDLEVSQRQQLSGFIAEVERRVDNEPDLDKRLSVFQEAIDRFPDVEHFQTNFRLAREKRDLIESIVSKAHVFEEQGQFSESLAQWEILRSIYDRYPGLEFEFQRLRKRRDHHAQSEARGRWLEQIEGASDSNQFARALALVEEAKQEFPGDPDIERAERLAREGEARVAQAQVLLEQASQMREEGRLADAVDALEQAHALDHTSPNVCEALQAALIEQARNILDADWRMADGLLKQAQDLGSGHYAVKGLLRAVADRRREEEIADALEKARALQNAGDLQAALALTTEKLRTYPQDLDIQQLHNRLKKQFTQESSADQNSSEIRRAGSDSGATKTTLDSAPRFPSEAQRGAEGGRGRDRLMTATTALSESETEPQSNAPEKKPVKKGTGSLTGKYKLDKAAFLALLNNKKVRWVGGGVVAALLLLAAVVASPRKPQPKIDQVPGVPVTTTMAVRSNPPGASLVINKTLHAIGDGSQLIVQPGLINIEATLPGYQPATEQRFLRAGDKSTVEIAMQLLPPSIRLETAMTAGQVFLDDKASGELKEGQYAMESLPEGPHKLEVKGDHSFSFNFTAGNGELTPTLARAGMGSTLVLAGNSKGRMQFMCNRSGLTLKLKDEADIGKCLTQAAEFLSVRAGRHTLEVMEGNQSLGTTSIELGPATFLGAYLLGDSDQGRLTVTSNQQDFSVKFDGRDSTIPGKYGRWPRSFLPGEHTIIAYKDGFDVDPPFAKVLIENGKPKEQKFRFTEKPKTTTITIVTERGAQVFSGGKPLGTVRADGTLEIPNVPLGAFPILLKNKGFRDLADTLQISAAMKRIPLLMQKLDAHVEITATPNTAQIVITRAGEAGQTSGSSVSKYLPEGTYKIEALAEGYVPQSDEVELAAGGTFKKDFELKAIPITKVQPPPETGPRGWPGWKVIEGYQSRTGGGIVSPPTATGAPIAVSFAAKRNEPTALSKAIGKGSLDWVFRSPDGKSSITFRLGDKELKWDSAGDVEKVSNKKPIKLGKGEHSVAIKVSGSTIDTSVDGGSVSSVNFDLSALGSYSFAFKIDKGETLFVKNFTSQH